MSEDCLTVEKLKKYSEMFKNKSIGFSPVKLDDGKLYYVGFLHPIEFKQAQEAGIIDEQGRVIV